MLPILTEQFRFRPGSPTGQTRRGGSHGALRVVGPEAVAHLQDRSRALGRVAVAASQECSHPPGGDSSLGAARYRAGGAPAFEFIASK